MRAELRKIARGLPTIVPVLLLLAERRWPLRPVHRDPSRLVTNAVLGLLAVGIEAVLDGPLARGTARRAERSGWGLARLPRSPWRTLAGVLWLDWTLYLWHRATHRNRGLWRLHLPHHLDPAMDVTTAFRFHLAELLASAPVRYAQVASVGVPEDAVRLWQGLLVLSISFHHSNLRLPLPVERAIRTLLVTPRLHGIHHSVHRELRDSNWSSGLTLWDRLHRTYRTEPVEVTQLGVEGVPPARTPRRALGAPFASLP
ncbi:MAG TPA: sterol desaturase family protein [Myxococcaceae bacterium]|nr:sterol desaturase family protein [Myxococcaceae bacterium]